MSDSQLSLTCLERKPIYATCTSAPLTFSSYISITLRFLTDELAFDNDEVCREFLESHGAQTIIEEKFDEKAGKQYRVKIREGAALFEQLRAAAFSKVDIKGQI